MSSNLPPGCTQRDIDRAAGFYPDPEEQAEIDADRADHARDTDNENLPSPESSGEPPSPDGAEARPCRANGDGSTVNRVKTLFYIARTNHQFRRLIRWIRKHKTT